MYNKVAGRPLEKQSKFMAQSTVPDCHPCHGAALSRVGQGGGDWWQPV